MKKEDKWFYGLLIFIVIVLVAIRSFPYLNYGPFGFGYDTGIYKRVFEGMTTFGSIFKSQIYIFPSFLGYVFNLLHIPVSVLVYFGYIAFSCLTAWPLYLLTKEFFGRIAGLIAVFIFTVSFVQVHASEFYLFKAMLGSIFMLFSFLYFVRKSYKFYPFAILLALTQLPQFLVLVVGTGIAGLFEWKKNKKFHLIGLGAVGFSFLFLMIFTPNQLLTAYNVVMSVINGKTGDLAVINGAFMKIGDFLSKESIILILAIFGFFFARKKQGSISLQAAIIFLTIVITFKLFFQDRYVVDLSLLLIPYAAYLISIIYHKWLENETGRALGVVTILILLITLAVYYDYRTHSSLTTEEQYALKVISTKKDSDYVLITDSRYAPWAYGYSDKNVLAPGIFINIWDFNTWYKYKNDLPENQIRTLAGIAAKYGKFYLFEGIGQSDHNFEELSPTIKNLYEKNGTRVYRVER